MATLIQCTEDLKGMDIEDSALKMGDRMPNFERQNQHGEMRRMSNYLAKSSVVLNI